MITRGLAEFANAGIAKYARLGDITEAFYDSIYDINVKSTSVPLGRFGAPDEIAKAVVFLASEDSSYITIVCGRRFRTGVG